MRTKATNFLQIVVLITGIIYISVGAVFFISPVFFGKIFSIHITEDWFNGIQYDTFIAPLFFLTRAFAAMLFSIGLSMVLPLYDPLKYRGLIYFTGITFPVLSSSILIYNGLTFDCRIILYTGLIFLLILILTVIGIIITNNDAKSGIE